MSGAVAAHAAHNGSGTQGLAVTNKVTGDDGDVQSVFWNANNTTRQLVYGSAFVEIPANSGSGTNSASSPITQVFDVNNDIDCLGDIVLKVHITDQGAAGIKALEIATLIDRVEIQVGTQIWQTIEGSDLLALASSELSAGSFSDFALQTTGGVTDNGEYTDIGGGASVMAQAPYVTESGGVMAFLPLKTFTKTLGPQLENFAEQTESGYLMAAAPHQQVKIKVITKAKTTTAGAPGIRGEAQVALTLFAKSQVMCNEEREALKAMPQGVPKRIKMSQHATKAYPEGAGAALGTVELDLDHFSLYASHLLVTLPVNPLTTSEPFASPRREQTIPEVELLLNSSSFSGKLPLGLLRMTPSSIGVYTNSFTPGNVDSARTATYLFPLASRAYSGSSVPLNRFDNIRLKFSNLNTLDTNLTESTVRTINVTCVGETTALYKNGAASLAMY